MTESQTESDRTAFETLTKADLGEDAVIDISSDTYVITKPVTAPQNVTAYRIDADPSMPVPNDTLILRHETEVVEIEHRDPDPASTDLLTELSVVTDNDTVRVIEGADEDDPDESGFSAPGFQSAAEVSR